MKACRNNISSQAGSSREARYKIPRDIDHGSKRAVVSSMKFKGRRERGIWSQSKARSVVGVSRRSSKVVIVSSSHSINQQVERSMKAGMSSP